MSRRDIQNERCLRGSGLIMYRALRAEHIITTAERLRMRIRERFPKAHLGRVSDELHDIAQEAYARCVSFKKPNIPLRIGIVMLLALGVAGLTLSCSQVRVSQGVWLIENFLEAFEALLGILVCIGASVIFLISLETRLCRRRALTAINELRALAHIIDMHQLTKDPEPSLTRGAATPHSPMRTLSAFELNRYFDYCSEMLSLVSKIAALYAQEFPDAVILDAVDDIEDLTTGLARKIWQKIIILERLTTELEPSQGVATASETPVMQGSGLPDPRLGTIG